MHDIHLQEYAKEKVSGPIELTELVGVLVPTPFLSLPLFPTEPRYLPRREESRKLENTKLYAAIFAPQNSSPQLRIFKDFRNLSENEIKKDIIEGYYGVDVL